MSASRKRKEGIGPAQASVHKSQQAIETTRISASPVRDEQTLALDAIALVLGLTLVALLFNNVASNAYMVHSFIPHASFILKALPFLHKVHWKSSISNSTTDMPL